MNVSITDGKGRPILVISDDGKMAVARYPDMETEYKKYAVECFKTLTDGDWRKLERFLNFEEDDNEFCS